MQDNLSQFAAGFTALLCLLSHLKMHYSYGEGSISWHPMFVFTEKFLTTDMVCGSVADMSSLLELQNQKQHQ